MNKVIKHQSRASNLCAINFFIVGLLVALHTGLFAQLSSIDFEKVSININGSEETSPTLDYLTISSTKDINRIDIYDLRGVKLISVTVENALNPNESIEKIKSVVL